MSNYKTAEAKDLKRGAVLICKEAGHEFVIDRKYSDGIWNTTGPNCVFECEISCYWVRQ